jgi:GH35 family endo-1,4-beta-xylanase
MTTARLTKRAFAAGAVFLLAMSVLAIASVGADQSEPPYPSTLRQAAPEGFRIGTAVSDSALQNEPEYREVLAREFNSVTAENVMKWQTIELSVNGYYSTSLEPVDPIDMAANARRFTDLGLKVAITEADVGIPLPDTSTDGLVGATNLAQVGSESVRLSAQAHVYSALVGRCLHAGGPACDTFTVWGFTENHSWIPQHRRGWGGATIFDTDYQPKAAYYELLHALHLAARAND